MALNMTMLKLSKNNYSTLQSFEFNFIFIIIKSKHVTQFRSKNKLCFFYKMSRSAETQISSRPLSVWEMYALNSTACPERISFGTWEKK